MAHHANRTTKNKKHQVAVALYSITTRQPGPNARQRAFMLRAVAQRTAGGGSIGAAVARGPAGELPGHPNHP